MTTQPLLFTPITLRSVTLQNRIVLSPLCMYEAKDGLANAFHFSHLTGVARGRAGLVFTEATAVEPEGRISHGCCGIWNDEQVEAYRPIVAAIERLGSVPAIQIAHAGRKASARTPWQGSAALDASDAAAGSAPWPTVGPAAEAVSPAWPTPHALTESEIDRTGRRSGICSRPRPRHVWRRIFPARHTSDAIPGRVLVSGTGKTRRARHRIW